MRHEYKKDVYRLIIFLFVFMPTMFYVNKWLHDSVTTTFFVEAKAEAASITATPAPEPTAIRGDGREYFDLFTKYFSDDAEVMYAVAQCESGLQPNAYNTYNRNKTVDIGLLQINSIHWNKKGCDPETLLTVEGNLACAKKIFDHQGFRAWSAYKSGCYKEFL